VAERLGITPDEMPGGHLPALGHPDELVQWLERYRSEERDRSEEAAGSSST